MKCCECGKDANCIIQGYVSGSKIFWAYCNDCAKQKKDKIIGTDKKPSKFADAIKKWSELP